MLYNNVSRHKNRTSKSVQYNKTDYELIKQLTITGIGISSGYVYGSTETEGVILTPNITVEAGSPKIVYFDYSKPTEFNVKPIKILRDFFSLAEPQNFIQGHIFSLSNATYNYSSSNLGATFAFQTFLNDVVVATTTSSIPTGYYSANKFDSIPTISKISSQIKQYPSNTFIITNSLPMGTNSFSYCGVEVNSILEFGERKFRVDSIQIKFNKEYTKEYVVISDTNPSRDTTINMPVLNNIGQNIIGLYKQNISVVSIASTEQTPLVDARWATVADEFRGLPIAVEYLVVAGGGGGGKDRAGGGGAGGFRSNVGGNLVTLSGGTSYTVTVGAGGGAAASSSVVGSNGNDSVFDTITSSGGGGGGSRVNAAGAAGGCGGGGGGDTATGSAGNGNTPATSPSQGNNGGAGADAVARAGGGGGGAGAVGVSAVGGVAGNGGAGTASSITGPSVTYAGGGGGGTNQGTAAGTGGVGGGGNGGLASITDSTAGSVNTGGGGGGGGSSVATGKSGGSGIVIVRYLGTQRATGGTVTTSGGYTIHTFTSSGTFMVL